MWVVDPSNFHGIFQMQTTSKLHKKVFLYILQQHFWRATPFQVEFQFKKWVKLLPDNQQQVCSHPIITQRWPFIMSISCNYKVVSFSVLTTFNILTLHDFDNQRFMASRSHSSNCGFAPTTYGSRQTTTSQGLRGSINNTISKRSSPRKTWIQRFKILRSKEVPLRVLRL